MRTFKTKITGCGSDKAFTFECYENTHQINIGDKFLFFFGNIADVQVCDSQIMKSEINKHDRPEQTDCIDLVCNFWRNCYKIKSTDFDLTIVD
jgi:hypothetical protein